LKRPSVAWVLASQPAGCDAEGIPTPPLLLTRRSPWPARGDRHGLRAESPAFGINNEHRLGFSKSVQRATLSMQHHAMYTHSPPHLSFALLCVCTTTHPPAPHELPLLYHRTRLLALLPVPSARPDSHHAYLRGCDSTSKARCLTMHRCRHDALCTTPPSIFSPSRVNSRPVLHSRVRLVALHSTNAYAALRWNNARSADDPRVLGQNRLDFCTRCVETNVPTHGRRSIVQVRQQ
jgi:hypothetical protein